MYKRQAVIPATQIRPVQTQYQNLNPNPDMLDRLMFQQYLQQQPPPDWDFKLHQQPDDFQFRVGQ